jgi:3'-5' exoribonuclease
MEQFCLAPGGISIHHNYKGGLFEHTVNTLEPAYHIGLQYGDLLNMDTLLMGCFLHDIGKIREMFCDVRKGYTEEGKLLGHIFIGVDILEKKMGEIDRFPEDLKMVMKHMIVSHHATSDFSSHRKPATPEAILLNLIESMDAKINRAFSVLKDSGPDGWTRYDKYLCTEVLSILDASGATRPNDPPRLQG